MANLQLYNYFRSSTSYRARIALHHKGLDFKYIPVHLLENGGEQHSPSYQSLNPMRGVPTLIHEDHVISQSMAIFFYLDEVFPSEKLFPSDPYHKAKVIQLCEGINADLHSYTNLRTLQYLEKTLKLSEETRAKWSSDWTIKNLEQLEKMALQYSGKYFYQDQVTAADMLLVPALFTANRFKVNVSDFPTLHKINERCIALDAFKAAHPFRQIDTPKDLKI